MLLACGAAPSSAPPVFDTGADDTGPVGGDPATVPLAGECPLATHLGGFVVEADEAYSVVDGSVADGVVPVTVLTELTRLDDCVLLRRENPHCDPTCASDETCGLDGVCVAYPTEQDLGTVTITGLIDDVAMTPVTPGAHYFDTRLANPAFTPGAFIELRAAGWLGDVTLHGVGVSPIVPGEATWALGQGQDLAVTWDVPSGVVRSEVVLNISIDQHGSSPASLRCVFVDDGVGSVPASLLDGLRVAGVSGFPNGSLTRRTADRVDVPGGCVDLQVTTPRHPDVRVDGVTPCDEASDCPDGLDCNFALEICE